MDRTNNVHLENVRYLLNRLNTEIDEKEDGKAINL